MSGSDQFLGYAGMCVLAVGAVAGIERLMKRTDATDEQDGADS